METRHVTYLQVKAVERDGERWIVGFATTPKVDSFGDVVVPEGAVYSLPIPLLFAHKHDEPIGSVVEAFVTKSGIRIRAKLTAGVVRAEEVWRLIQDGALTAVSVGFGVIQSSPLPKGGLRFDKWDWRELSVVSVPANSDARISVGKSLCYAAPGTQAAPPVPTKRFGPPKGSALLQAIAKGLGTVLRRDLGQIKARLDALEKSDEAKGIRFRGFYRGGQSQNGGSALVVRKNDAYTHDGSLWIALRDTNEPPIAGSPDWCLAARKGADKR